MDDWKQKFFIALDRRNQKVFGFQKMTKAYKSLCKDFDILRKENVELTKKNNYLSSMTTKSDVVTITQLKANLINLQEELATVYRTKAESFEKCLELNKELKNLKDLRREQQKNEVETENLRNALKNFERENERLKGQLVSMTSSRDILQNTLNTKDDTLQKLIIENTTVTNRIIELKQKDIDATNEINDLMRKIFEFKQELMSLKSSGSFTVDSTGLSLGGGNNGLIFGSKNSPTSSSMIASNIQGNLNIERNNRPSSNSILLKKQDNLKPPSMKGKKLFQDAKINSLNLTSSILAVACDDKTVKVFDAVNYNPKGILFGATDEILKTRVSPNNKLILGGSKDGVARLWDATHMNFREAFIGHSKEVTGVDFTADSLKVVTCSLDQTIRIWELYQGSCLKSFVDDSPVNDLDISRTTDIVASVHFDNSIKLWDIRTGKVTNSLKDAHPLFITSVSFSRDGLCILTNSKDNSLKYFDIRKFDSCIEQFKHEEYRNGSVGQYNKAVCSPCGEFCCAGSTNGCIFIWNCTSGKFETKLASQSLDIGQAQVHCCSWSSEGKIAYGSEDRCVYLYL